MPLFQAVRNRLARHTEPVPAVNEPMRATVRGRGNVPLCSSTNKRGGPCGGIAVGVSGLCLAHQPGGRERMAKLGRRGGRARERTEAETLIGMGMGHMVALDALYEVATSPLTSEKDKLRAAQALLARAPARVERGAGGGWTPLDEVNEYLAGETAEYGSHAGQSFPDSQPEVRTTGDEVPTGDRPAEPETPPERTQEDVRRLDAELREEAEVEERRLYMKQMEHTYGRAWPPEDLAEVQWRQFHPNGRPWNPYRGRSRSPYGIRDKELTG